MARIVALLLSCLEGSVNEGLQACQSDECTFAGSVRAVIASSWDVVSVAYHSETEARAYTEILREMRAHDILDCACGTGFPCLTLAEAGFKLTASDEDEYALTILRGKQIQLGLNFPVVRVPWLGLPAQFAPRYFDAVLCLGSSITYYDTWSTNPTAVSTNLSGLSSVLASMRQVVRPSGKVIIGFCKLYDTSKTGDEVEFPEVVCNGLSCRVRWDLKYDWPARVKTWTCYVRCSNLPELATSLKSHLMTRAEFMQMCRSVFRRVTEVDLLPEPYQDTLIVCER